MASILAPAGPFILRSKLKIKLSAGAVAGTDKGWSGVHCPVNSLGGWLELVWALDTQEMLRQQAGRVHRPFSHPLSRQRRNINPGTHSPPPTQRMSQQLPPCLIRSKG